MDGLIYGVDGKKPGEETWAYGTGRVPDSSSTPVPEPATLLLLGSGLLAVGAYHRKK